MELGCEQLNNNTNYEKQYNIFKNRQLEMKEKVQEKFKEYRKLLRAVEMKVIDSLYVNYA